jgi:hypothetical protein
MKEQKVLAIAGDTYDCDKEHEINKQLELGWNIVSVTAQYVSSNQISYGGYLIVLEREIKINK